MWLFGCPSDRLLADKCLAERTQRSAPPRPGFWSQANGCLRWDAQRQASGRSIPFGCPAARVSSDEHPAERTRRSAPPPPGWWALRTMWGGCRSSGGVCRGAWTVGEQGVCRGALASGGSLAPRGERVAERPGEGVNRANYEPATANTTRVAGGRTSVSAPLGLGLQTTERRGRQTTWIGQAPPAGRAFESDPAAATRWACARCVTPQNRAAMWPSPRPSPAATWALLTGDRLAGEGAMRGGAAGRGPRVTRACAEARWLPAGPSPPGGRGWPRGRVRG